MTNYQNILITTDLSDDAQVQLDKAIAIAQNFDATVALVHAVEPIPFGGYGYIDIQDVETQMLDAACKKLHKLGQEYSIPESEQYAGVDLAKHYILKVADKVNADLIIICSHSKPGFLGHIGSTADAINQSAKCDVLILRNT